MKKQYAPYKIKKANKSDWVEFNGHPLRLDPNEFYDTYGGGKPMTTCTQNASKLPDVVKRIRLELSKTSPIKSAGNLIPTKSQMIELLMSKAMKYFTHTTITVSSVYTNVLCDEFVADKYRQYQKINDFINEQRIMSDTYIGCFESLQGDNGILLVLELTKDRITLCRIRPLVSTKYGGRFSDSGRYVIEFIGKSANIFGNKLSKILDERRTNHKPVITTDKDGTVSAIIDDFSAYMNEHSGYAKTEVIYDLDKSVFSENNSKIKNAIKYFYENSSYYEEHKLPKKLSFMLYGKPGTGKTKSMNGIIYELSKYEDSRDMIILDICDAGNSLTTHIRSLISSKGEPDKKQTLVLIIDELDTIINERIDYRMSNVFTPVNDSMNDSSEEEFKVNTNLLKALLELLDGRWVAKSSFERMIIITTTNHYENIDPALVRGGRITYRLEYGELHKSKIRDFLIYLGYNDVPDEFIDDISNTYGNFISHAELESRIFEYYAEKSVKENVITDI